MTQSVVWQLLENWGRSTVISDYEAAGWTLSGNGLVISYDATIGKFALISNLGEEQIAIGPQTAPTISKRFYITEGAGGYYTFGLADYNGSLNAYAQINAVNQIISICDHTGPKYTSPFPNIFNGVPYFIEVYATASATNGTIIVKINEIALPTVTGANTDPSAIGSFYYMQGHSTAGESGITQTDFGCLDTTISGNPQFYGDNDVQVTFAISDNAVQFTPNGLTPNWMNAAGVPNVANYNSTSTAGDQDTFVFGNLSVLTASVGGIYICSQAENTSGGLHTYEQAYTGSTGSSPSYGPTNALTNGYRMLGFSPAQNPATGAAWTISDVNGMKAGQRLVS